MIAQEPVQAAIWHCLNHYDYADAVFLSQRLYAEVKTDESLYLLATAYFRSGLKDHAYFILKDRTGTSPKCRYLFGICAYELEKYAEAEAALLGSNSTPDDEFIKEYDEQACFVWVLLGRIAAKTERKSLAIEAWKKALKLNPFLWTSFELLCEIGDKPNPQNIFQITSMDNLSMCQANGLNSAESIIVTKDALNTEVDNQEFLSPYKIRYMPDPKILFTPDVKMCTPESPLALPLSAWTASNSKFRQTLPNLDDDFSPNFGQLYSVIADTTNSNSTTTPTLTESNNHHQSLAKRVRAQVDQFIGRKESIFQNCKPVFSQSSNVPVNKTPNPLFVQSGQNQNQNVRRSTRLFSSNYSVKENNKSPNRNKFPVSSPRKSIKTKRLTKCDLNKNNNYSELNTRNKLEKEKSETVTSEKKDDNSMNVSAEECMQQVIALQKHSADGLMCLLRELGQAYLDLSHYECNAAIERLHQLPRNQFDTAWVHSLIGVAYFELPDYEMAAKYFGLVHDKEPHRLAYMDLYSTALWHLQREVALSALAHDLINTDRNSPVTWCASGNCFSLHKEHDTAIKFFQRAVQVDPNFPYAYTLLGHEYITTEELDKAMSCFRNAIRLDPRHYNAWFGIGTIYSKQERYSLAEMNYLKALSINPHSSVILCHIGVVQNALKQHDKALVTLNQAITNNPKNPLCKFHRGSIYFALGRYSEALKELEELKEIVPKESLVYYLIGKVHKKLGNTDLALMHFSWATDLDPKGASSQIKEAFEPAMGDTSLDDNISPASDTQVDRLPRMRLNFDIDDSGSDTY
ncbi:unnamed protein product [Acanthoscelides obtectus]|uniref:Cell division cycle protein 27 homolog n=2 Tax=Acanthoscelides obtectus TaxID=200917 RepID=A0A9P0LU30_ACAOB|nr:unnamed protein product [Acanthoscelides obtectus]CAK1646597.1 Cell division cycle protein 27 homolog [Acanthoscelides obtectus]